MLSGNFVAVSTLSLILTLSASAPTDDSTLISVFQVFRHGLRTPINHYPNDPYADKSYWPAGPGQLVNVGKQQHYELGQFTRKRYGNFLPKKYISSLFFAETTNVDRTHMSAQCNLAALWEPNNDDAWSNSLKWQPIPVHPSNVKVMTQDDCKSHTNYLIKVISNDFFTAVNEEFTEAFAIMSENAGYEVNNIFGAVNIYDTLLIEDLHGFELPSWTKKVYPDPLEEISAYAWLAQSYTLELKKIGTGLFFNNMIKYFESIISDPNASYYKYKMFSAHDTNIAALLSSLGAFTPHAPWYASTIYFELREKKGNYFINIWHKNKETFEQITPKGCTLNCSLKLFKALLADVLIDENEYETLCNEETTELKSTYALSLPNSLDSNLKDYLNARRPADDQIE